MVGVSYTTYLTAASRYKAVMLTLSTIVREILRGIYAKLRTVTLVKLCATLSN